ncbi:MAG: type II toxin-antitoxin system VapC family toxin [Flavobacteriales bacterium]|nr:type II toxin-antitoxin system VapC family toxin [Flavobacteriales bacterium]
MIVLDTHILVWWISGDTKLSAAAKKTIAKHLPIDRSILISSITAWEIAMLVEKGRLVLNMEVTGWLAEVSKIPSVEFVPVDNVVGVNSTCLPGAFHKDPADRMIVAFARQGSYPLVTADEKILNYKHVKTVW